MTHTATTYWNTFRTIALFAAGMAIASGIARAETATFDDLGLPADDFYNGSDSAGSFTSGGVSFVNNYDTTWMSWSGWAVSSKTDSTTAGWGNQYSAITGGGVDGSATYGVGNDPVPAGYPGDRPQLSFEKTSNVAGAWFTNTTYAVMSMREGDSYAKQFGGPDGDDPDWFLLMIAGIDANGARTVQEVPFYLADYRETEVSIVDEWTWVDLSSLGPVDGLQFELSSTDVGDWGMNTPSYFAMDNLQATPVPEPSTTILALTALLAALAWRRRKSR